MRSVWVVSFIFFSFEHLSGSGSYIDKLFYSRKHSDLVRDMGRHLKDIVPGMLISLDEHRFIGSYCDIPADIAELWDHFRGFQNKLLCLVPHRDLHADNGASGLGVCIVIL